MNAKGRALKVKECMLSKVSRLMIMQKQSTEVAVARIDQRGQEGEEAKPHRYYITIGPTEAF